MTVADVKQLYLKFSQSTNPKDRFRAKGYAQLLHNYNNSHQEEYYEEVRVSLVAEDYMSVQKMLLQTTGKDEYKWHIRAAIDCIINYPSDSDLIYTLKAYKGNISERDVFKFLDTTPYKNKVKYNSVKSLCDVINLPVGEAVEESKNKNN